MGIEKILFVSGVARSGTSELVRVLNIHDNFLIGQERYFYIIKRKELDESYFNIERFMNIIPNDTHVNGSINKKIFCYDQIKVIGDKYPNLFDDLDWIFHRFPNAYHIYIIRNPFSVAQSYQRRYEDKNDRWTFDYKNALEHWNNSVRKVCSLEDKHMEKFIFLIYEEFYSDVNIMNSVFKLLSYSKVDSSKLQPFVDRFKNLSRNLTPKEEEIRYYVAKNADWESYKYICNLSERQFNGIL